ncbi:MAG TPA: efflux RND transporter periplasmic adaptor subunit [Saprospiraceae bacterium]|nr:efflux RND transporter periplasmic adaptor subunit [Saprospiraceae bacterium]HMQ84737.1 efflux RND transporter periplasmic adaptor subunit [Saprospiraceae bacterium]
MKNILFLISFFFLLLVVSCSNQQPEEETPPTMSEESGIFLSKAQMNLAGIETGVVEKRKMAAFIECTGQIEAPPQSVISVYSPVQGVVQQVKYLPGDFVKKGAWLTALSHPDLIRLQREWLEVQSRLPFLKGEFQRKETLLQSDAASRRAYEEAEANYKSQLAHANGLKAELELIGIDADQLLADGKIQPSIPIYAPASAYLTEVNINPGKLVGPSDKLYEMVDDSHLHLELQVFAKDLPQVKPGQHLEVKTPGGESLTGVVHQVGKVIDQEKKTAMVHGHFEGPLPHAPAGTFLNARIYLAEQEVTALPHAALVTEGEKQYVFVYQNDRFEKVAVETGLKDATHVELRQWNYPPETKVAVKGAYYIQEEE